MTCTRCNQPNPNPYLRKRPNGTREPHKWCKACMKESSNAAYAIRREKIREAKGLPGRLAELQAAIHEITEKR